VTFVFSSIAFRDEDRWIYLSGIRKEEKRERERERERNSLLASFFSSHRSFSRSSRSACSRLPLQSAISLGYCPRLSRGTLVILGSPRVSSV